MSPELLKIINSFGLWVVALVMVSIVFIQAGLFMRQALKAAAAIKMQRGVARGLARVKSLSLNQLPLGGSHGIGRF